MTYLTVRRVAEREARSGVAASLDAVAELLVASLARAVAQAAPVAATPALGDFLRAAAPTPQQRAAALGVLETRAAREGVLAVELWDAGGARRLAAGAAAAEIAAGVSRLPVASDGAALAGAGPFQEVGGRVITPLVAGVGPPDRPAGWLVQWTPLSGNISLQGSRFFLGNRDGRLWTDLKQLVPGPPLEVARLEGALRYDRAGTGPVVVAAAAIAGTPWIGVVEMPVTAVAAVARRFLGSVAAISALLFLLSLPIAWRVSRGITAPLGELTAAAEAIAAGDLEKRVALDRRDELGRLATTFNSMAEGLAASRRELEAKVAELERTRAQFTHAQRLQAVGKLAGGVAHDFNNLLTIILGEADLALQDVPAGHPAARALGEILAASQRAAGLTRQLLAFSRRQLIEPTTFDLNALLFDTESMLRRLIGEHLVMDVRATAGPLPVNADRGQIEQVVVNLVVNARDAMVGGGSIHLETQPVHLDETYASGREEVLPGDYALLIVSDTGHGMSEEVKAHLFEPFFTTKEPGRGTGLGLAACYGIIKQAGGHLAIYSEASVGTTVKVYLPRVGSALVPSAPIPPAVPRGSETILLVEDEMAVRDVASRMLSALGYRVLVAADAETAQDTLAASSESQPIDLLVTDVVLPRMSGRQLAEQAALRRPGLPVLFVSGYTDDMVLQHRLVSPDVAMLQKPFTFEQLGAKVREMLDRRAV